MPAFMPEADQEAMIIELFRALGYAYAHGEQIGPEGSAPERISYADVLLNERLMAAIQRLNPHLSRDTHAQALTKLTQSGYPTLLEENRRLHAFITHGVPVEYRADDGTIRGGTVRLVDFAAPDTNDWLVVNQFVVIAKHGGNTYNRRPDLVVFLNGLPVAVIELKAAGSERATLMSAYNQLQTYKQQIPALFNTNAMLMITDGYQARIGSLSADYERFMPWRTVDGITIDPPNAPELATVINGIFAPQRFLALLADFTVFRSTSSGITKIIAGYHQFHAVQQAIVSTIRATVDPATISERPLHVGLPSIDQQLVGDKKVGVIWHTQGSGKSLLMAFYVGQLVTHPAMHNPTIVVVTDRNDLDDQLFATFVQCQDLIRQTPIQAESRDDLHQQLSSRASGGVFFTTIQKFTPDTDRRSYPVLSNRHNIVVIADEAHRSQYGLRAKVDAKTGDLSYGFAKYLRDALPNAAFIGFTGTPIEHGDTNTPALFGTYINIYDIARAVEDRVTVPIYYESRLARIDLDDAEKPQLDAEIATLTEDETVFVQESLKRKWATQEALIGSDKRIALVAADIVQHFEDRVAALDGKALLVGMSRRICVKFYDAIVALRPTWHSDDDHAGVIKIVMTGSASDPLAWQPHIGGKARRDLLAKRLRDPNDPLAIVIVRDMWLTGFDAPCLHTMYVDKSMERHGLMQAIARVNRVFKDKPAGLIVDYIGIAQNLKTALQDYSQSNQDQTGIDEAHAIAVLQEKYEIVRSMFYGFDYTSALHGTPHERLVMMADAINWILVRQHRDAEREATSDAKKQALRRYQDAVLALSKAFALASASDEARRIRDEVGFFQAIRTVLIKSDTTTVTTTHERDLAVQQLVSRAVISTDIVDILKSVGLRAPNISILSDDFLAELQHLDRKNLALEALRKLLNDGIRSRSATNIVQTKAFSKRLEDAMHRYHTHALTTVEIIQELIELAKDLRSARQRGEEHGMSEAEIAFYDALAENESAIEVLGDAALRVIAHELLVKLKQNVAVDWANRASARAKIRLMVKKILKQHGYPPDLQDAAVQTVLQQAEVMAEMLVRGG